MQGPVALRPGRFALDLEHGTISRVSERSAEGARRQGPEGPSPTAAVVLDAPGVLNFEAPSLRSPRVGMVRDAFGAGVPASGGNSLAGATEARDTCARGAPTKALTIFP